MIWLEPSPLDPLPSEVMDDLARVAKGFWAALCEIGRECRDDQVFRAMVLFSVLIVLGLAV